MGFETFLGLLGHTAFKERVWHGIDVADLPDSRGIRLFYHVINYVMIGIGALYVVLGVFCCKGMVDARKVAYDSKVKRWKARVEEARKKSKRQGKR